MSAAGRGEIVQKTMKAVLLTGYGGYECLEYRTDVPVPRPAEAEVLVAVGAAGVNNTDINTRTGWYSPQVAQGTTAAGAAAGFEGVDAADPGWTGQAHRFPRIQGADGCGRIVAVGAGVPPSRVGERVLIEPIIRLPPGRASGTGILYLGSECDGTFAEFVCVPAVNAHAIDTLLTDVQLASFPCAYGAAEHMIERSGVAARDLVLVTGASGGVGSAAVQLAVRRGARVIAVAGASKARSLHELGADRVIERDADLVAELGRESVDVVIDVVGGPQFGALLEVLRRAGRYAAAGAIAGPIVQLDLRTLYLKDLVLQGCTVFEPPIFRNLVRYIERGEIRPLIAGVYALEAIVEAQRDFSAKAHTGKIVLEP